MEGTELLTPSKLRFVLPFDEIEQACYALKTLLETPSLSDYFVGISSLAGVSRFDSHCDAFGVDTSSTFI